ncbi:hypothetical protein Tco_0886180, partial [Tanacetum coccineum]
DGARSSRVPIPLLDDPYMAARQAYLATITDSESEPFEDFRETKIPQPLPIASSPVPPSDDPYLIVGQAHTPAAIDTESEPEEAPSETEELQPLAARTTPPSSDHTPTSSDPTPVSPLTDEEFEASEPSDTRITSSHSTTPSDSTTPLSPDHPLTQTSPTLTLSRPLYYHRTARMAVRTQPTLSPGFSARLTETMALLPSSFCKRYRSSYETPSSSASPSPSPTLPIRKSEELEDEGPDSEGYEAAPEGQQQQVTPVEVTTADRPLGLGYGAARRRALEIAEEITPSTFEIRHSSRSATDQHVADETPIPRIPAIQTPASPEWSSGSLPVSPASLTVPSPVASLATTPTATIEVDEDEFLEVGAQLELHWSILHDHTQRLDAFPPTLLEGHGRDITKLFDKSRAVREEIHSQLLALKAWAGHTDAQRAAMWQKVGYAVSDGSGYAVSSYRPEQCKEGFQPERLARGLESVSIRRIQGIGYGVLEFLGVGTTFDIFQNILFPYSLNTAYCLSWIRRIGLVSFVVFGSGFGVDTTYPRHGYAVSSLMDTAYW